MADIWPIENVWTYIKEKLEELEILSLLKQRIITTWNTITQRMYSK